MRFIDSNGNFSMVARAGAPLFINMRDPFIETLAAVHLQTRVYPLLKEKIMTPKGLLGRPSSSTKNLGFTQGSIATPPRADSSHGNIRHWRHGSQGESKHP